MYERRRGRKISIGKKRKKIRCDIRSVEEEREKLCRRKPS